MNDVASTDLLTLGRLTLVAFGCALVFVAAFIDVRKFIIPNWLNASLLGIGLLYAGLSSLAPDRFGWVLHIAMLILFFSAGTLLFAAGFLGGGDVKLLAVLAFWSGPDYAVGFVFYTALAGGLLSVVYLAKALIKARRAAGVSSSVAKDVAAQAILAHTGVVTEGKAYLQRIRTNSVFKEPIPYGVAIAAGGVYVFASIAGHLG